METNEMRTEINERLARLDEEKADLDGRMESLNPILYGGQARDVITRAELRMVSETLLALSVHTLEAARIALRYCRYCVQRLEEKG